MARKKAVEQPNGLSSPISFAKKVELEMLSNTYVDRETQRVDPRYNRQFVIEKWRKATIGTLPSLTYEEWCNISAEIFNLQLEYDRDRKAAAAAAVLDKAAHDPELLAALEARIEEIKNARESRVSDRGRAARQTALV